MKKAGQKILLIDDNAMFIHRLALLIKESGNSGEIFSTETYDDALSCLAEERPDIVFLDIHLKNKSGMDLLKVIRLSGWDCKVIMLKNETKKAYRAQCERLGSFTFLDKSNDFENIPHLLKELN
jgi:DNA-binding NarL/FixJ family response regulator